MFIHNVSVSVWEIKPYTVLRSKYVYMCEHLHLQFHILPLNSVCTL